MNQPSIEQQLIIDHIKNGKNVVVDACAGSGKSTTILSAALAMPDKHFLQITYNAALRKEVKEKAAQLQLKNLVVHTYHSLAVAKYSPLAHTDTGIRHLLYQKMPPLTPVKPQDVVVLDESQDMTLLYYQLVIKYLRDMGVGGVGGVGGDPTKTDKTPRFQLMVLGDYMQGLYEFKGADIRFLTHAADIWRNHPMLLSQEFEQCTLKTSYRITDTMAHFVNDVMLGESRLLACKTGEPVVYIRNSMHNLQRTVVFYIRQLIDSGVNPSQIFVLGASVKGANSQIRRIENALSEADVPCHVPMFENDRIDEKVIEGKVVFSTFHCVKGRQRDYVFVVGFDQSYLTFFAQNLSHDVCPNTLYVACTRATKKMFLLESDQNSDDRPLSFLKCTHHEMKQRKYVEFRGQPRSIFYERADDSGNNAGTSGTSGTSGSSTGGTSSTKVKTFYTTPTDLIKFIPESVLEEVAPILEQIFVCETAADAELAIPNVIRTQTGYEDVSDLNGIAIPAMYFDYVRDQYAATANATATGTNATNTNSNSKFNVLYEMIDSAMENVRAGSHRYLHDIVDDLSPVCESISDYLYMANVFVATQEKLYFKLKQIGRNEYDWLSERVLGKCKARIMHVLGDECLGKNNENGESGRVFPSIEKVILNRIEEDRHSRIDECLRAHFPGMAFRFTARVDLMTEKTMWELKCTTTLSQDHLLQVVIYAWIMRTLYSDSEFTKDVKIFNIKTGEIRRLVCDKSVLDKIVVLLLRGKYVKMSAPSTETFVADCRRFLEG